jgi:hypothetical protein
MTTKSSHRSAKPKPIPSWMQPSTATPLDGWQPPAHPGKAPPTRKAPPDKPKHTPKKAGVKAKAAAARPKPKGSR